MDLIHATQEKEHPLDETEIDTIVKRVASNGKEISSSDFERVMQNK